MGANSYLECTCMSETSIHELFQRVGTELYTARDVGSDEIPEEKWGKGIGRVRECILTR